MQRRALLAATVPVAASLAGCLDGPNSDVDAPGWSHGVAGRVDTVADDRLFYVEEWGDHTRGDGSITALGAADGEHLWSYGSSQASTSFTDPAVADAVYVGYRDDTVGGGGEGELYAVELDGSERWTVDTGRFYERPRVHDGGVYVGSDDGVVRAVDADTGEVRWRQEVEIDGSGGPPDPTVEAVDEDAVYVLTDRLLALDPATGDRLWRFGDESSSVDSVAPHQGIAYVRDGSDVRAVEDGAELWTATLDVRLPRVTPDDGRVFVRGRTELLRLDADDGAERWRVDVDGLRDWTAHEDRLYASGTALYAYGVDGGDERWSESIADGQIGRVQVASGVDAADGDHAAFVELEDEAIHRVSPDGEVTWNTSVPGSVRSFVVDDLVFVGSEKGVFAYDPA